MSKKPKTGIKEDLWAIEYVDHMDPDGGHISPKLTLAEAEARHEELTEYGTKNTEHDKTSLGFYRLIRVR